MATIRDTRNPATPDKLRAGLLAIVIALGAGVAFAGLAAAQTIPTTTTTVAPVTTTPTVAPPTTSAPATTAATIPPPNNPNSARITPIIECTWYDTSTKLTSTVWGYRNLGPAVTVPIGDLNHFSTPAADAGQTTNFKAGRDKNVFVVTTSGDSTWTLTHNDATSPGNAKKCSTNPVPIVGPGLGGLVALAVVTLVMGAVLFWRMRRVRRS